MRPLKVVASLYNGFAAADDWAPALDGILAYWMLYLRDPDEFAVLQARSDLMTPIEGLPLERISDGAWWWYAASSPIYRLHEMHAIYFHRRFDDQHERFLPEDTKKIITKAGPYKAYRKSLLFRVTPKIEWHCVGDESEIRRLLAPCRHVGAKSSQGHGRVRSWEIEEGDEQTALFRRPLPEPYARRMGIDGAVMRWGIRPPARIAANQTLCVMPCAR